MAQPLDDSLLYPRRALKRRQEDSNFEATPIDLLSTQKLIKTESSDDIIENTIKTEDSLMCEDIPNKFEYDFDPYEELFSCVMKATDPHQENRLLHSKFQLLPSKEIYPDYYDIIEYPIDLKHIAQKIQAASYTSLNDIENDLLQMTRNACIFNEPCSQIYKDAETLEKLIIAKKQEIEREKAKKTVFKKKEPTMSAMGASVKEEPETSDNESVNSKNPEEGPLWHVFNFLQNVDSGSVGEKWQPTSEFSGYMNGPLPDNQRDRYIEKWTKSQTEKLIELRGHKFKHLFKNKNLISSRWQKIKAELGVNFDIKMIAKKWSNLVQKYKIVKDTSGYQSSENYAETSITWPFYNAMDEILRIDHAIKSPSLIDVTGHVPVNPQSPPSSTPSPLCTSNLSPQAVPSASPQSIPNASPQSIPCASPQSVPSASPQSVPSASPQPGTSYSSWKRKATDKRKTNKYLKKLMEQNNRMLVLLNSFVVANGGEGLGSEVEVPLPSSDEE